MQERQVQSLSWEDPLQEEMATHSSNLAWKIPWTEEPGGLNPWGHRDWTDQPTMHTSPLLRYSLTFTILT